MSRWNIDEIMNEVIYSSLDEMLQANPHLSNLTLLFHGSGIIVYEPVANSPEANPLADFGIGFYVTSVPQQAERWAQKRASNSGMPYVSVYSYDNMANVHNFGPQYSLDWLLFVKECRSMTRQNDLAEVIFGRVADDDVYSTVQDFVNDKIGADETMALLEYQNQNSNFYDDQFCFLTQHAIKNHLVYQGAYHA